MRRMGAWFVVLALALACSSAKPTTEWLTDAAEVTDTSDTRGVRADIDSTSRPEDVGGLEAGTRLDIDAPDVPSCTPPFGKCNENADCCSGFCVEHMDGKVCSQTCIDGCPSGFTCKLTGGFGDPIAICVSRYPRLCRPCKESLDCESGEGVVSVCVIYDMDGSPGLDGAFCGGDCDQDEDCPDGFACLEVKTIEGNKYKQCARAGGLCPCGDNAAKMGLSTICEIGNDLGICPGKRKCKAAGPISDCDAPVPALEVCDGIDNDCNGTMDDPGTVGDCCVCGNGIPEGFCGETPEMCCPDFSVCGNEICECGENACKCPVDCCGKCGDKLCVDYKGENGEWCCHEWDACPEDCKPAACGNGICEPGENPSVCPEDCAKFSCDNSVCEPGEDKENCPQDCDQFCGNCMCEVNEFFHTCPVDCGWCGDGYCSKCVNMNEWDEESDQWLCLDCCDPDVVCKPDGEEPLQCGNDGCGGSCGTCGVCDECQDGQCVSICPTWTDPTSGLTWRNPPAEITMTWSAAKQYCTDLGLDGGGWHLPTIGELRSLIRGCPATEAGGSCNVEEGDCLSVLCKGGSCIGCSEVGGPANGCYWPGEMLGSCVRLWSSSAADAGEGWGVNFAYGSVAHIDVDYDEFVRCVRDAP